MSRWLKANKFSGCASRVIEGEAGPAVARFLDQQRIDLTVLGTSARSHAARLLLGSVAEEIFRKANCLVLVLGPKDAGPSSKTAEDGWSLPLPLSPIPWRRCPAFRNWPGSLTPRYPWSGRVASGYQVSHRNETESQRKPNG